MASPTKPNILVIMSDEHAPQFSGLYGHPIVQSPHLDALGRSGVTFDNGYCNSPLCVPSRASFVSGKHVHRVGAYDNGAPFPSETVTFAHLLRLAGYEVVLDGKMHFVGPDKLHGFERQLTRDARGAGVVTGKEWAHTDEDHPRGGENARRRIDEAGPGRAHHLDFDDEVEAAALDWLREPARKDNPWCLVASFLCPHFPLVVPDEYFSRYYPNNLDMPSIPSGHLEGQHAAHSRVRKTFVLDDIPEERVRVGRAAYFGLISYLDDKIGRLMAALKESGQAENTVVVYTADHGELAGEHGLWWKNSFYEHASRIPILFSWPGVIQPNQRFAGAMSNVDVARTLVHIGAADNPAPVEATYDWDGETLLPLLRGVGTASDAGVRDAWKDEAIVEYFGHATNRVHRMIRTGRWKYAYYHREGAELYDLQDDPAELRNLSGSPEVAGLETALRRRVLAGWDPDEIERQVRASQRARSVISRATGERNAGE
jgi:choline-sulfatase